MAEENGKSRIAEPLAKHKLIIAPAGLQRARKDRFLEIAIDVHRTLTCRASGLRSFAIKLHTSSPARVCRAKDSQASMLALIRWRASVNRQ